MTAKDNTSCQHCAGLQSTEWEALSAAELAAIDQCKKISALEPGEILYNQGDEGGGIYCIKSGLIGLRRIDINGNSILVRLVSAGSTVGYRTFLTRQPHINSAEALTSCTLCYVPRPRVESLLKTSPTLGERFLQHFYDDTIATENDYVRSLTMGMKSRFLHLILVFYERFGYEDDNGNAVVDLPVKKGEIAELVGVRPESISRLIDQLQSDEILQVKDRRVEFSDVNRVLEQAGATV